MSKCSTSSAQYARLNKTLTRESALSKEVEVMFRQDLIEFLNSYLDYQQSDLGILFEQKEGKSTMQINLVYRRGKDIKVL
ncbi:MAG: hypothetical protein J6V83_04675 [Clostridia bacterium]|nr:hypothetical protein [Clostridia bacterium]